MSDPKRPDSITAAILADPKSFLPREQGPDGPPPPLGQAADVAKDAAAALKAVLQDQPMHVGDEHSGLLASPENPLLDTASSMKPSASITADILSNPSAFLTPEQRMANALGAAKDAAAVLKGTLQGEPGQVGNEQSGQLRPQETPSLER